MMEETIAMVPFFIRKGVRAKVTKAVEEAAKDGKISERDMFDAVCLVTIPLFRQNAIKCMNKHKSEPGEWVYEEETK